MAFKEVAFDGEEYAKYNKYEVILSGGREDSQTLYIMAQTDKEANVYADAMATSMGYITVAVSDEKTQKQRRAASDGSYQFFFPKTENALVIEAPDLDDGVQLPALVLVVTPDKTQHFFDPGAADKRRQEERARKRAERTNMLAKKE